jgi:hypothetical protein
MQKYPMIEISIVTIVLLILGSLTNVVGYETVKTSNQKVIKEDVYQQELLFQTIVDLANNKEIRKVIQESQMKGRYLFNLGIKSSLITSQILTKRQLKLAYYLGLLLSKSFSTPKIKPYMVLTSGSQKRIITFIDNNAHLRWEITQLSSLNCHCGNEVDLSFPRPICTILEILWDFFFNFNSSIAFILDEIIYTIATVLFCEWAWPPPDLYK